MNQGPSKQKKILIIMGTISLVILPLMIFASIGSKLVNVKVTVAVSPADARITVDGQESRTGSLSLSKGKHAIVATRDHFTTTRTALDTEKLTGNQTFYIVMTPADEAGRQYLANHPEEQTLREQAAGNAFSYTQQTIADRYPFVTELPYETIDYKVDYVTNQDNTIRLKIFIYPVAKTTGSQQYNQEVAKFKAEAQSYLKSKKIDTSKVQVEYIIESNEDVAS
jgi:hypothetical protein